MFKENLEDIESVVALGAERLALIAEEHTTLLTEIEDMPAEAARQYYATEWLNLFTDYIEIVRKELGISSITQEIVSAAECSHTFADICDKCQGQLYISRDLMADYEEIWVSPFSNLTEFNAKEWYRLYSLSPYEEPDYHVTFDILYTAVSHGLARFLNKMGVECVTVTAYGNKVRDFISAEEYSPLKLDFTNEESAEFLTIDGSVIPVCKKVIESANILEVKAGSNGLCGGDSGHGSRTFISLKDLGSTDIRVTKTVDKWGSEGVEIILGGDTELQTVIEALDFVANSLRKKMIPIPE